MPNDATRDTIPYSSFMCTLQCCFGESRMSKTKVVEQKPDHHYRTELPNIMLELGLPVYALALYTYYKKVAGDSGHCNTSNATIQRVMGFSPNTTKKYRDVLARPHPLLGGKPLICVTENRVTDEGDQETVLVRIVDIWTENTDWKTV